MLGSQLVRVLTDRGHEVAAPSSKEIDVTDLIGIATLATGGLGRADWIFNCAAYTAVDKAESQVREAVELNAFAPGYLANAAQALSARLFHVSTDFVFDGDSTVPYQEEDTTNPLSVYGKTKRDGEDAILRSGVDALIIRTSWLFEPGFPCFPSSIIRGHEAGKSLRVVADQIGSPTRASDLARVLVDLAEKNSYPGIYHACGPESMSWHTFAERILQAAFEVPIDVEPISTADWPTAATRPKYSVLSTEKLLAEGIATMPGLDVTLAGFKVRT